MQTSAFRFGIIGFLLGAYHPERLVAFEAARYVVTDKQPHAGHLKCLLRLFIFAIVANYFRSCYKTEAGVSQNTFWLSDPRQNLTFPNEAASLEILSLRGS